MQTISINFIVPESWPDMSDKQLRYVFELIAQDFATDEVKTLCLAQWSGTKVIGRKDSGSYLLKKGKILFEVTPLILAEVKPSLGWLDAIPASPVRLKKLRNHASVDAEFQGVPFETYIVERKPLSRFSLHSKRCFARRPRTRSLSRLFGDPHTRRTYQHLIRIARLLLQKTPNGA